MHRSIKLLRRAADHFHVIRILAIAGILAMTGAAKQRSASRSERRDQAQAQRSATKAPPRSSTARRGFSVCIRVPPPASRPAPAPGYMVDHIIALKRGGLDVPGNMQWQSIADAKAKDRVE